MINRIVDEINRSLENDCHLAALALALMLPDMCGKAEFPNERSTKARYISWYEENIGRYLREMSQSEGPGLADRPYLSGELIYLLRNSFLHSGDTDIDTGKLHEEQNEFTAFNLELRRHDDILASGASSLITYSENGEVVSRQYNVGVTYLCKIVSKVALNYYEKNKDKFNFFSYNLIDLTTMEHEDDMDIDTD